jgi:multiple antibiotic resistance protein
LVAMMAIVNPPGLLPIWSKLTDDLSKEDRRQIACMVMGTASSILLLFLIFGKYILHFFSIDLSVFSVIRWDPASFCRFIYGEQHHFSVDREKPF